LIQNPYDTPTSSWACCYTTFGNYKFIFCRHSADTEEDTNKLHFKCTDFTSSTRVTVYSECIYVLTEWLKYVSIRRHVFFDKMWVALKRAGCCVVCAFGSSGRLSTVPASRNCFNNLFLLTSHFVVVHLFICQPLCCVPL